MNGALFVLVCLGQDEARDALRRMAERCREFQTLSARFTQIRKTSLLAEPLTSSGMLHYRRQPSPKLVFRIAQPRTAEIHLDASTYQTYRPEERRLEQIDLKGNEAAPKLLMIFDPRPEEIEKSFKVTGTRSEVRLEPADDKVRRALKSLTLSLSEADASLRAFAYADAEGDEVLFELSDVRHDPKNSDPNPFELRTAPGTRILKHAR